MGENLGGVCEIPRHLPEEFDILNFAAFVELKVKK